MEYLIKVDPGDETPEIDLFEVAPEPPQELGPIALIGFSEELDAA